MLAETARAHRNATPHGAPEAGAMLARATARAVAMLGLSGGALAAVSGASEATVSLIVRGARPLSPHSKSGELAILLVRLHRSLDALVGSDESRRLAWMRSHNDALGGRPDELIRSVAGLAAAVGDLDGRRAPL
jgi:hypothetical protein